MLSWVEYLPFETPFDIEELTKDPIDSKNEIEEGDRVLGEMNDTERLLYSLWIRCEEECRRAAADAEYARTDAVEREAAEKASRMHNLMGVFRGMLWVCVRDRLGWDHDVLVPRKGFQVAAVEHKHHPRSLAELLHLSGEGNNGH